MLPEIVDVLLKADAVVNADDFDGNTALHLAALYGHQIVVDLLLKAGANVNRSKIGGKTALHVATEMGRTEIVRRLLKTCVEVDKVDRDGHTALHFANYVGIAKCLIEAGANIHVGNTVLMYAVVRKDTNMVDYLIHHILFNICLALSPLTLPPYILLEIVNWLPHTIAVTDYRKIGVIQGVINARRKVFESHLVATQSGWKKN